MGRTLKCVQEECTEDGALASASGKKLKSIDVYMLGWGCRSMIENLPSMYKALGSTFSTAKKQNKAKQKQEVWGRKV